MRNRLAGTLLLLFVFLCTSWAQTSGLRKMIDLSGTWSFALDPHGKGEQEKLWNMDFAETVTLPGTTDSNRKGIENTNKSETTYLSRYYKYEGAAWYSRNIEIPADWKEKHIVLFLERTRPTTVWIDGREVGKCNYLSTPQEFNLTHFLAPGSHKLTIRVDNGKSIPGQIRSSSHACTESTQTNWNGIIGRMELQAMNPLFIESIQAFPQVEDRSVKVKITLSNSSGIGGKKLQLSASAFNTAKKHKARSAEYNLKEGSKEYEFTYQLGDNAVLWSDLQPALYQLKAEINGIDEKTVRFGLRDFKTEETHFTINGAKTFLRGKHDACVFPLTGHTAMDLEQWRRYFRICKEYGLNHCRFHSWCPPAACFEAADLEGIYLQPELPIWGGFKKESAELMDFLMKDGENIMREYSNHASFVLFALGNELGGDINVMKEFVDCFRSIEPRHLYTYGSNIFLGSRGHIPGEDFLVTCRVGSGEGYSTHARASFSFADAEEGGYLNNTYPNSVMNFDEALEKSPVPVIGHETGQFQTYPNYEEMKKYTGVLAPWNFEVFRDRLEKVGMLEQADDFFKASGAWSVELYRADIEMNLRSKRMAGFQLLDLQDYPGQGSAYVGILDAFMDSKGIVAPETFYGFCAPLVPLALMKDHCWLNTQPLHIDVALSNYVEDDWNEPVRWSLVSDNGVWKRDGVLMASIPQGKVGKAGSIDLSLSGLKEAQRLTLTLTTGKYRNYYHLWVYPDETAESEGSVHVASFLNDDLRKRLESGASVLLIPDHDSIVAQSVGGMFTPDYWNYSMFKTISENAGKEVSPGTLSILTDPGHPLLKYFPTECHSDWQWWSITRNSRPMILNATRGEYRPLIQVVDNIERNHKLGLVFEFAVGKGKLLVCMTDLQAIAGTPEGNQFRTSLLRYMKSDAFHPTEQLAWKELDALFHTDINQRQIIGVKNESDYTVGGE